MHRYKIILSFASHNVKQFHLHKRYIIKYNNHKTRQKGMVVSFMARYSIVIDAGRCTACNNCVTACKDEHCGIETKVSAPQPHTGQNWIRIDSVERGNDPRRVKTSNVPTPCIHCQGAPCQESGNDGAVYTRPDGIVIIDPEKAKGQRQLVDACPINAIFWNEELDLPQKCTMCAHLLDEGHSMPRCVEACPNEALIFGDMNDLGSKINRLIAQGRVTPLKGFLAKDSESNVIHLNIPTVFAAGTVCLPGNEPADGAIVILKNLNTGDTHAMHTNNLGDWEFEWLDKSAEYKLEILFGDYEHKPFRFIADTDKYLGEIILTRPAS